MNNSIAPNYMTSQLYKEMKIIEQEFNIKILYAVESEFLNKGTNLDSPHEIEFIYVNKSDCPVDEKYRQVDYLSDDKERYYQGNELRNFLYSLAATSAHMSECLMADTVHYAADGFRETVLQIHNKYFNPQTAIHDIVYWANIDYWDHIEYNHYRTFIQFTQCHKWPLHKFKYFLRPLLVCKYIEQWTMYPSINFKELVDVTVDEPNVKTRIYRFIDLNSKPSRRKHPFLVEDILEDYASELLGELRSKYEDFKSPDVPQRLNDIEEVYRIFK